MSTELEVAQEAGPVGALQTGSNRAMARQMLRNRELSDVKKALTAEATAAGADFFYSWGSGKDRVSGPSQELAFAAARLWGNCLVENDPSIEHSDSFEIVARFTDLETGFSMTRSFLQAKDWTIHGRLDSARKNMARFSIGQSKAARNVILKALPSTLIRAAMEAAQAGVREAIVNEINASDLKTVVSKYWTLLRNNHGISNERILHKFGYSGARAMTAEDVVILVADLHQLDSGQEFAEVLYPEPEAPESPPEETEGEVVSETAPKAPKGKKAPKRSPKKKPKASAKKKTREPVVTEAEAHTLVFLENAEMAFMDAPSKFEAEVIEQNLLDEVKETADKFGTEIDAQAVIGKVKSLADERIRELQS